jgi:5'-nucleotidase
MAVVFAAGCADDVTRPPTQPDFRANPSAPGGVDLWLTVLHNNDGESNLIDLGTPLEDFGGVARFATVVDDLRRAATTGPRPGRPVMGMSSFTPGGKRAVVLVSSGDNYLAGPEFNASLTKGVPFYDAIALDLIGYDALALGNHEFDFGPDVLADFIAGFSDSPTFLSANLGFSAEPRLQAFVDQGVIAKSTVVSERGDRIGIIGATTPNLPFISSPRNVEIMDDVAGAIQGQVNALEAMGVNKIILISHLQDIGQDMALAPMLHGVDVMVAGGGDELLANPDDLLLPGSGTPFGPYPLFATDMDGTQVPVVTTEGNYGYVGRLVVGFDKSGNVVDVNDVSGPVRVAGGGNPDAVAPDPEIQSMVVDPVEAALADLANNVIGVSAVALDGRRSSVRSMETNEGNLIADALLWQAQTLAGAFGVPSPDVALQNGGGIRNDSEIPAGNITELTTFSMVPFSNFVSVLPGISRAHFKEILENAVSRTQPGDTPGGTGRFAQIGGFAFSWSASGTAQVLNADGSVATPGTRVQSVVLDDGTSIVSGGSVVAGADVVVATIDFLARGGDQYPFRGAPFTSVGVTYQQALANYIVNALGGSITAGDYPEGGEGRNTQLP